MDCTDIAWTLRDTTLGLLLVAASERGVCLVRFGESAAELEAALARELPWAALRRDDAGLARWSDLLARAVEGRGEATSLPLDVAGSRFQRRVWDALRAIPRGATRSYADVAQALGAPRAVRAVANACAANPTALAVPCHRVVPRSGGAGGYRWGVWRKRALLAREGAAAEARPTAIPSAACPSPSSP
jgi:AraC family transcriptional regulator of adaptative response/methylated-DNA-[protein]-cysteine methyltransferase